MGGVAGHLAHLYDNRDLSYNNIKNILSKAAAGEIIGTEKTDGFNIYLGYVDGLPRAARNKGDMAKGGMTFEDLVNREFQGGTKAKNAYLKAFQSYKKAVDSLSDSEKATIFGPDGEVFYNAEIQGPSAQNVVNYDEDIISIHRMGHKLYNAETNTVDQVDTPEGSVLLDNLVERFEEATADEPFSVRRTAFLELNKLDDGHDLNIALERIQKAGLTGTMTIGEYLENRLHEASSEELGFLSEDIQQQVIDRILKKEGFLGLNKIYKGFPDEVKKSIKEFVEQSPFLIKTAIWPIEIAIHDFAVELLKGVQSAYILDNDAQVDNLKSQVEEAIRAIQKHRGPYQEDMFAILEQQLEKLKHHDKIDTVVEGFVFQVGDQMYKFTGNFAPVNQLLGLFKYGRGNIPPLNLDANELEAGEEKEKRIIAIYPGRFQPMGQHHAETFKRIQEEFGPENTFVATSNVVNAPKSPLNFAEKQLVMMEHGISPDNVVEVKNPYNAAEILEKFDPNATAVTYVVGEKDMQEDARFGKLGGTTKDGAPRYFRNYAEEEGELKGHDKHGYIKVAPHVSIDIPEVGEMSGTNLRKVLRDADEETFKRIMGWYDPEIHELLKSKFAPAALEEAQFNLGIFRGLVDEILAEEDEDLEEISSGGGGSNVGAAAGLGVLPRKRKRKRKKKKELDEMVNDFYDYLLHTLKGN